MIFVRLGNMRISNHILLVLMLTTVGSTLPGQSINTTFGKNRVQHHDDFERWNKYETENFITYWYGKAKLIAEPVMQMAEMDHKEVQGLMEHRFNSKIKILVYLDVTDLKQSNIGVEDAFISSTGQTKIVGNKMFVYYDGNHSHLRKQIRKGIASVYMNSMLFGNSLQEVVQNAVLLNLPSWYKEGLVSYISSYWDLYKEDELRDILEQNDDYYGFEKLSAEYPKIAGHSMWNYIEQNFGRSNISNILYLTRINRNLKSSFLYVLSVPYETIEKEWTAYYKSYYQAEASKFDLSAAHIDLGNKPHQPISKLRLNPDGSKLMYVYNDLGKYKIKIMDLGKETSSDLFSYGYKNSFQETDYNYPLFAWNPNGKDVSVIYEDRDVIKLRRIYLSSGDYDEQLIPENYHRIYSFDYLYDDEYVFAASTDGYADLYRYRPESRTSDRITHDFYDDLDASVVVYDGSKGILWSSNRESNIYGLELIDTILPLESFDIFFMPLSGKVNRLQRLTYTPLVNERYPHLADDSYLTFLNDETGIVNRYAKRIGTEDNGYPNSNFPRNAIRHHSVASSGLNVYTYYEDGAYRTFLDYPVWDQASNPHHTYTAQVPLVSEKHVIVPEIKEEKIIDDEMLFQSPFGDPDRIEEIKEFDAPKESTLPFSGALYDDKHRSVSRFNISRAIPANLSFRVDNFTTKMDNDVLFEGLESYAGDDKKLTGQPLGILVKATIKDLFEDYAIEGGVRLPTAFNGSEYFLVFEDRSRKIDRKYALYRKSVTDNIDETVNPIQRRRNASLLGLFQLKYPFDIYRSVRLTTSLRFDQNYLLSSDAVSHNSPFINEKRLSLRGEYVYDNTRQRSVNIYEGTRYKFYLEGINLFNVNLTDNFEIKPSLGFTTILGADFRHYIPVFEKATLAFRAAGATSLGSDKMLYYLGGMENWMFSKFNEQTSLPKSVSFAYKTLAPHLRGFKYNIRNGSSYMLTNVELRLPVFRLFLGDHIKSGFFSDFQVVLFYDAGLAWHGLSPFGDKNPINSASVSAPPAVLVKVKYFRDPLVMGYGAGVRTSLFGYFLKLDLAYGIETRKVQEPILYFTLGTDF